MKTTIVSIVLSVLMVACSTTSGGSSPSKNHRAYEEKTLSNGMKLLLVRDDSLPYLSLQLMLTEGSISDPQGKEGLASLTANLLEKGTKSRNANRIADDFGFMASDFSVGVMSDYVLYNASTLSKYQADIISLFAELFREPVFVESEINLIRTQAMSQIRKLSDNPSEFSDRAFDYAVLQSKGYGRPEHGTLKSLASITRSDILNYYKTQYNPQKMWLSVVGKWDESLLTELEKEFGSWKTESKPVAPQEHRQPLTNKALTIVTKPGLTQSQMRFATRGISRKHPDYFALRLANVIFGSGFTSRLVSRVRDQMGLTYHISSGLNAWADDGILKINTFTKNETVEVAYREVQKIYREFALNGVTEEEVKDARDYMIGQFPQIIETAEAWAQNLLILRLYGVSDDYLLNYVSNITKLTRDDVNRAIKAHMSNSALVGVVYSDADKIGAQSKNLSKDFGEAQNLKAAEIP